MSVRLHKDLGQMSHHGLQLLQFALPFADNRRDVLNLLPVVLDLAQKVLRLLLRLNERPKRNPEQLLLGVQIVHVLHDLVLLRLVQILLLRRFGRHQIAGLVNTLHVCVDVVEDVHDLLLLENGRFGVLDDVVHLVDVLLQLEVMLQLKEYGVDLVLESLCVPHLRVVNAVVLQNVRLEGSNLLRFIHK